MRVMAGHRVRRRTGQRGQSLTELAIFLPILLILFLGIADLARIYATMITIEAAAREAADFGANGAQNFDPLAAKAKWAAASQADTVAQMERRACTPALGLPEYVGAADGSTCTNPSFACTIRDANCSAATSCDQLGVGVCAIEVSLSYNYDLIVPGGVIGLPATVTFARNSIFNLADPPPPETP